MKIIPVMIYDFLIVALFIACSIPSPSDSQEQQEQQEEYTVTYMKNAASSGEAPLFQTKIKGEDLTLLANTGNLQKNDYILVGWNTEPDGSGTDYAFGDVYNLDSAIVLYAKWHCEEWINSFGFKNSASKIKEYNGSDHVQIIVPNSTDISSLVPVFDTFKDYFTVTVATDMGSPVLQHSGITEHDFSKTISFFRYDKTNETGKVYHIEVEFSSSMKQVKLAILHGEDLGLLEVFGIEDMSFLFVNVSSFHGDISAWDVSTVTDMSYMFYGSTNFNQDLGSWNVGNVEDMSHMFEGATVFNQDLPWNDKLANVKYMSGMFKGASSFNGNIAGWNVGNVEDMSGMFEGARSFNQDLPWNDKLANVKNMSSMFYNASSFNGNIADWNVSNVEDMSEMFAFASSFNQDLPWNDKLSNVKNMSGMFYGTFLSKFNGNITGWNVSNVEDMSHMFEGARSFNQDLPWNDKLANVKYMSGMFKGALSFNRNIAGWNVGNVEDMSGMFEGAGSFNQDLPWNDKLSNVKDMSGMFKSASSFNGNIAGWNVSNVEDMSGMFAFASSFNQDLPWNDKLANVKDMSVMFQGASSFNQDISAWNISQVTNFSWMFNNASAFNQDISGWDNKIGDGLINTIWHDRFSGGNCPLYIDYHPTKGLSPWYDFDISWGPVDTCSPDGLTNGTCSPP